MKKLYLKKGLTFVVLILFLGLTFAPSINADIDTSTIFNKDKHSQKITEEELYESRYMDIPLRYRYITEDGEIHTVTKTRTDFMAERIQSAEEDYTIISANVEMGNHPPIIIESNDEFTSENGVTGGSGTEEDPYIIEDWVIVGDGSTGEGIFINNTDAYFVIRNCTISYFTGKFYSGIKFSNVKNGKIEGTDAYENYDGIKIFDSAYIEIINCTSHHNTGYYGPGIFCARSSNITITSSECYNNSSEGIWLYDTPYCVIEDTSCYNNSWNGIRIAGDEYPNEYNTIKNCKIYNNDNEGIFLFAYGKQKRPAYNHILDCEIYNNGHWPDISNAFAGIVIANLHNNIIENCSIHHNGEGIEISLSSNNNIIRNCSIHDQWMPGFSGIGVLIGGWFVTLEIPWNNTIEHCDIYNQDDGIWLTETFKSNVQKNNVFHNNVSGIDVDNFFGISTARVKYNNIYGNGFEVDYGSGLFVWWSLVDARHNWWGSDDGPSFRGHGGSGDTFKRWWSIAPYRPWEQESIPNAGVQE